MAGILTKRFGRAIRSCRSRAAAMVAVGVAGELGGDFDRYEAVGSAGGVECRAQQRTRVVDVVHEHPSRRPQSMRPAAMSARNCCVVVVRALDRRGKDGRIRRHPADAVGDEACKRAVAQIYRG